MRVTDGVGGREGLTEKVTFEHRFGKGEDMSLGKSRVGMTGSWSPQARW